MYLIMFMFTKVYYILYTEKNIKKKVKLKYYIDL